MANKLTLDKIFQIVDNHVESGTQFMFITDKDLAEIICEYVADNYNLIDDNMQLDDQYKDYFVSLYVDEDGLRFICETARCIDGDYKYSDALNDNLNYFICNDMTEQEADKYLLGECCTWSWVEVVADEEYEDCEDNELEQQVCECPICDAERDIEEIKCFCNECEEDFVDDSIEECLERVFNGCPDCVVDSIIKLAFKCLEFGKENAKQKTMEFLET